MASGSKALPPDGLAGDGDDMVADHHGREDAEWPAGQTPQPPKVLFLCDYGCNLWALVA